MKYQKDIPTSNDIVLIVNPELPETTIRLIHSLSSRLGYEKVHDFSKQIRSIQNTRPMTKSSNNDNRFIGLCSYASSATSCHSVLNELFTEINTHIGIPDTVIHRHGPNKWEQIILSNFNDDVERFTIDDGLGDYISPVGRWISSLDEIIHALAVYTLGRAAFVLSLGLTRDYRLSKLFYLGIQNLVVNRYCNIDTPHFDRLCILDDFRSTIRRLFIETPTHQERKIIIVGSLIVDSRFTLTIEQEIDLYNKVIIKIKNRHGICSSSIWYKPHPRLPLNHWLQKRKSLNCQIFDLDELTIAEIELCNPHLQAVYSVGSTTLIYAHLVFGIPSFRIDIRHMPVHYARHKLYHDIFKKYDIPEIVP